MRIIPVVDLMAGQVVRGIGGRRSEYRPVQSRIATQATPTAVAAAFVEQFGFREAYVADLDAIAGGEPDWNSYRALAHCGLQLWVDAGVGDVRRGRQLLDFMAVDGCIARVIAGLESSPGADTLAELVACLTPQRLSFSLDLKRGEPVTTAAAWSGMTAEQIADCVVGLGVTSLIVLDLSQVGMNQGVGTQPLCRRLRQRHPQLTLIAGGGVRTLDDLRSLSDAGCDAALVASALHDGRLTPSDIRQAQAW